MGREVINQQSTLGFPVLAAQQTGAGLARPPLQAQSTFLDMTRLFYCFCFFFIFFFSQAQGR